jgi:hypothetical protein
VAELDRAIRLDFANTPAGHGAAAG